MKKLGEFFVYNRTIIYSALTISAVLGITVLTIVTKFSSKPSTVTPISLGESNNLPLAENGPSEVADQPTNPGSQSNSNSSSLKQVTPSVTSVINNTASLQYCSAGDTPTMCDPTAGVYSGGAHSSIVVKKK